MTTLHIVVDLDGTLFDERHRQHHITGQTKDWDAYHGGIPDDKVFADVEAMLRQFADVYVIHALTGRPAKWFKLTDEKLRKHNMPIDVITMRPDEDWSPNGEMKLRELERYFGSKERVLREVFIVLENDPKTVEVMRNYGLTVWQVRAQ